jgi:mannosyltransferase
MNRLNHDDFEIILGNSNKRFSGVTSTMLQVLDVQKENAKIVVLGKHHLADDIRTIGFFELAKTAKRPLPSGKPRIFHARRNDEMIQGVLLKYIFRNKLKLIFTSTAQRPKTWITRWLMGKMDGLLTTCNAAHSFMEVKADRIIPHGIDVDRMRNQQPLAPISLPTGFRVGIFGRVRKQKGIDLFVDALINLLPKFPEWSGVIVGQITEEQVLFVNELKTRITKAGLADRFVFMDEQAFVDIPALYRSMDIVTCLSINEGFGLTALEAMSVEKPVVATRAGAWPDIIDDETDGYIIDVSSEPQLRERLTALMESQVLRETIGRSAAEKVDQKYAIEREADALLIYYKEVQNNLQ